MSSLTYKIVYNHIRVIVVEFMSLYIRESVDSLCRDGADTPIVRVHTKAF